MNQSLFIDKDNVISLKLSTLQFYILNSRAENYGQDYDDKINQNHFRVLYHPENDKSVTGKTALVDPEDMNFKSKNIL